MSQDDGRIRFKVTPAIFTAVLNDAGQVLLQRRARTGYMDGYYDFPSGHLEPGETLRAGARREAREEVGIEVAEADLELFHINQNCARGDLPYMNFIFRAKAWTGRPALCEPDKCDDVGFFTLGELPKITPQVRRALQDIAAPLVTYSYFTEKDFDPID